MNEPAPAPDWQPQPQTVQQPQMPAPPAPTAAPAPFSDAPAPFSGAPAPVVDAPAPIHAAPMPADAAAALDATAAMSPAMPAIQHPLHGADPMHPDSAALPHEQVMAAVADTPADPAADPGAHWWAPGNALVLAVAAFAWQFISYYAREQLPVVESSGAPLTNFDNVISNLPLAGSGAGPLVGILLAAGAVGMLLAGMRRGLKEPVLQGGIAALAVVSMLLVVLLPMVA